MDYITARVCLRWNKFRHELTGMNWSELLWHYAVLRLEQDLINKASEEGNQNA